MDDLTDKQIQRLGQFLTTEHFTLQGLRNGTISEANGRLGHYLSAVGSGIVALAFVADVSEIGMAFLAFSAVIFPSLIVLGLATLVRLLQIGVTDSRCVQAINRIRHFYVDAGPEALSYLSFPHYDDPAAVQRTMNPFHAPGFLQGLATTPGPVILINSVLAGTFGSVLAVGPFLLRVVPSVLVGVTVLIVAFVVHVQIAARIWPRETREHVEVRFPTPEDEGS